MLIFDLPRKGARDALRVGSLGSCRVRNPISALSGKGSLCVRGSLIGCATHTSAEAVQTMNYISGALDLPEFLNPYVFGASAAPSRDHVVALMRDRLDACLVEISGNRQFSFEGYQLQQNFLPTLLVQARGAALLGWFRQVCKHGMADEETVETALIKLRQGGFDAGEDMERLLRGMRFGHRTEDEMAADMAWLAGAVADSMVVVGPFLVPGDVSTTMAERAALGSKLRTAAEKCGAAYFDLSPLISEHGRERALGDGGANIQEFADGFQPVVGEAYVNLLDTLADTRPPLRRREPPRFWRMPRREPPPVNLPRLADTINQTLVALHARRLEALGPRDSGLFEHYSAMIAKGAVVGRRERATLEVIVRYLPRYDAVTVLRAGLGELALLIAAAGASVTAVEPHEGRRAALEAGRGALIEAGLISPRGLRLVGTIGEATGKHAKGLVVGLDATLARGPQDGAAWLEAMRGFDALLIDPRLFIWRRESPDERAEGVVAIEALGYASRRTYPSDGLIWLERTSRGSVTAGGSDQARNGERVGDPDLLV
jgi:hypothetical protein